MCVCLIGVHINIYVKGEKLTGSSLDVYCSRVTSRQEIPLFFNVCSGIGQNLRELTLSTLFENTISNFMTCFVLMALLFSFMGYIYIYIYIYICIHTIRTNRMHHLCSIYFNN